MRNRLAFTLIEVLISIALLGIILPALYSSVELLQDSNAHLFEYLQKSKKEIQATQTLYLDIASSDGNLTFNNGEYDRFCISQTKNSLYGLSSAQVCWLVLKKDRMLARVEGDMFHLPVKEDERVEVDTVMKEVELFDVYWKDDKVVVLIKKKNQKPVTFMVQGITKPKPPKKKPADKKQGKPPGTNPPAKAPL